MIRETEIEAAAKRSAEFNAPAQRVSATLPVVGADTAQKIDRRSLGERFAASPAVKNYRGQQKGDAFDVGSFYPKHQLRHTENTGPEELRTLIYGGALAADQVRPQLLTEIYRGMDLQGGSVRDVLINGTTTSDAITYFRELAFTNAAAGVAEASNTTDTSGTKPESAITFEQATDSVKTIAHWIPVTRQTLDDVAMMETYVNQRLLDGLKLEESDQLLNGAGGADLTGILQTSNVQALNAAYFTTTPVTDPGSPQENFNRILRAKFKIRTPDGHGPRSW
jgi:HK97 family phage major capsid protein